MGCVEREEVWVPREEVAVGWSEERLTVVVTRIVETGGVCVV